MLWRESRHNVCKDVGKQRGSLQDHKRATVDVEATTEVMALIEENNTEGWLNFVHQLQHAASSWWLSSRPGSNWCQESEVLSLVVNQTYADWCS